MSAVGGAAIGSGAWVNDTAPPQWLSGLLADGKSCRNAELDIRSNDHFTLVSTTIPEARKLNSEQLGDAVHRAYMQLAYALKGQCARHPVRFWNHICGILDPMPGGLNRYMAYNVGRHRAFCDWFGSENAFGQSVATASGVGCAGEDVVIHVLAASQPGISISNPRQVEPFHYSERYGPRPPCFARATAIERPSGGWLLLIGGTAAVRGEQSVGFGSVQEQLQETLINLQSLLQHAGERLSCSASLADLTALRIYLPDESAMSLIRPAIQQAAPHAAQIEWVSADLCRRELLLEIEGCAALARS